MTAAAPITGYIQEVEQEVLGALLAGGDMREVGFLREEHFIADVHKLLFRAIGTAFEQYGSTKAYLVSRLISDDDSKGFMVRTGSGAGAYIANLAAGAWTGTDGLERSGRAVVSQWGRLKSAEEALRFSAAANDPSVDPAKLIRTFASDLDDIAGQLRSGPRRKTMLSLSTAAESAFAAAEKARQRGTGVSGVTWGLADLNRVTGGVHAGEVVLVGARPSMGKTAFGLSCGIKMAKAGIGVGFHSLEMGSVSLANRAITDLAFDWGVKHAYSEFGKGRVEEADMMALRSATQELQNLPLWIEEQRGLSMSDIRVKTERMMEEAEKQGHPLKVLVIDYLGLIKPTTRYSGNKTSEIGEISSELRELAGEYDLGVIALSQLSRQVESRDDKRPQLSDLRDSGALEQDADTIMFLYRAAYYLGRERESDPDKEADRLDRLVDVQNKLECIIAKQRNGPVCTVDLFIDIACSAVRNGESRHGY